MNLHQQQQMQPYSNHEHHLPPIQVQSNGLIQNHIEVRGEMATLNQRPVCDWYNEQCQIVQKELVEEYTKALQAIQNVSHSLERARTLMDINLDSHLLTSFTVDGRLNSNTNSYELATPKLPSDIEKIDNNTLIIYVLQDSANKCKCQPRDVGFCRTLLLLCEDWRGNIPKSAGKCIATVNVDGKNKFDLNSIISYSLNFISVFEGACEKLECEKSQYKELYPNIESFVLEKVEPAFRGKVKRWLLEDLIRRLWIVWSTLSSNYSRQIK